MQKRPVTAELRKVVKLLEEEGFLEAESVTGAARSFVEGIAKKHGRPMADLFGITLLTPHCRQWHADVGKRYEQQFAIRFMNNPGVLVAVNRDDWTDVGLSTEL